MKDKSSYWKHLSASSIFAALFRDYMASCVQEGGIHLELTHEQDKHDIGRQKISQILDSVGAGVGLQSSFMSVSQ